MKKRYYVSDVIQKLGIARNTLYNWEHTGKIPKAKRDPFSRHRYYTDSDIIKLKKLSNR